METRFKGRLAELKVEQRAFELGLALSKPIVESRYDYILDNNGKFERVQVKYSSGEVGLHKRTIRVYLQKTRVSPSGQKKSTRYSSNEIDVLLVYVPQLDKVLRFEADDFCGKSSCYVYLDDLTKSGQSKNIKFAKDYLW